MRPQQGNHLVSLAHTNSLIEIVFEQSLENRVVEVALHGNKIHPYSIGNRNYLCIVPGGSNNIILTTKEAEAERQYALDVDSGTKPNTRYVFTLTPAIVQIPIRISPWSDTTANAILEEHNVTSDAKEFIYIEGYAGVISLMVSDTLVRLHPHLNSKEKGEGIYYFPSTVLKNKTIDSLLLEEHSENILIGRNTSDLNPINLKVDSNGKLLFRKAKDGNIPINTVDELRLINTDLESNYKQEVDIDLSCISKRSWEPIGNFGAPFKGTYDGDGYTIHSLNMDIKKITAWNPDPLKGEPSSDFNILDHLFDGYYWMLPAGAVGLFGVNQGTITNVHIASGTISVSEIKREYTKSIAIGVICGYNDGGYITFCTNNAELKVHTIYTLSSEFAQNVFTIGGICGTSRGSIEYSINYGKIITGDGTFSCLLIGGICGSLYSRYETDRIKINSCINHGGMLLNIISYDNRFDRNLGITYGGIAGMMYYCNSNSSREIIQHISNCYNTGNVTDGSGTWGGFSGIVPTIFSPFSGSSCRISSCYDIGNIYEKIPFPMHTMAPILNLVCEPYQEREPYIYNRTAENCFYNATIWEDHERFIFNGYRDICLPFYAYLEYRYFVNPILLSSTPAFSQDSWPTSDIWDTSVWGDLGSWNNGNPIYPKLRFEKD
jgi:hypothetical protein